MRAHFFSTWLALTLVCSATAQPYEVKPNDPSFEKFTPKKAPAPGKLLLKSGDRLAIIGDSITEQKMYSRMMETYLTVCVPDLGVTVRQYGWSGERASGFLGRMTNDCLRFKPTIATTCYGMNDHEYRPYEERIGKTYAEKTQAILDSFKSNNVRAVLGSPGCVGKMPSWVKTASGTVEDLNLSLCTLRNIDVELAARNKVAFADVFWPMYLASFATTQKYGTNYCVPGKDGVHPGWAGHTIMAYAYLRGLGLDGDIGQFTVDWKTGVASVSKGHQLLYFKDGELQIKSSRYPFCATGSVDNDNSIRSGMTLVPFNEDLNRLMLVVKNADASKYKITWGPESHSYSAKQLARGVNLAEDFVTNAFSEAFIKVDKAVATKQSYETEQIKKSFRSAEAKTNLTVVVTRTESERAPLAKAIQEAFVPVTHTIKIEAEK